MDKIRQGLHQSAVRQHQAWKNILQHHCHHYPQLRALPRARHQEDKIRKKFLKNL